MTPVQVGFVGGRNGHSLGDQAGLRPRRIALVLWTEEGSINRLRQARLDACAQAGGPVRDVRGDSMLKDDAPGRVALQLGRREHRQQRLRARL